MSLATASIVMVRGFETDETSEASLGAVQIRPNPYAVRTVRNCTQYFDSLSVETAGTMLLSLD